MYHVVKAIHKFISSPKIELTRHEATQKKYSPKITEKYRKIPKY